VNIDDLKQKLSTLRDDLHTSELYITVSLQLLSTDETCLADRFGFVLTISRHSVEIITAAFQSEVGLLAYIRGLSHGFILQDNVKNNGTKEDS
jgi:hypothetical protein